MNFPKNLNFPTEFLELFHVNINSASYVQMHKDLRWRWWEFLDNREQAVTFNAIGYCKCSSIPATFPSTASCFYPTHLYSI